MAAFLGRASGMVSPSRPLEMEPAEVRYLQARWYGRGGGGSGGGAVPKSLNQQHVFSPSGI